MATSAMGCAGGAVVGALVLVVGLAVVSAADEDEEEQRGDATGMITSLDTEHIPADYTYWINRAGKECSAVSAPLIAAQIAAESNWNPKARSSVGAEGLSQFMPGTWKTWGVDAAGKDGSKKPDGEADPFTPGDAIMSQARYVCWLAGKVKKTQPDSDPTRLLLAAYNAGPGAIEQYGGAPPFPETQNYVTKIISSMPQYSGDLTTAGGKFGDQVVTYAKKWLGTPYAWGGGGPEGPGRGFAQGGNTVGFDCSSLVQYSVYRASQGRTLLPRTSQAQVNEGKKVARDDMRPGDVIGFDLNGSYDHIGIYLGGGQFIHAPKTGDVVKISELDDGYWSARPQKVRRFG